MVFETASFHIVKPCNMKCKFCYATFDDMHITTQLSFEAAANILLKLKKAGLKKITFAGGEPMLYKHIFQVVEYSKSIGLTTSLISNGTLLTDEVLDRFTGQMDWIGVSVDSLNPETNQKIGRTFKGLMDYKSLVERIKTRGFRLKINTVVNRYNEHEDLNDFINWAQPERWKVFDTLRVEGQNDKQFDEIRSTDYQGFLNRHPSAALVAESNEVMTGSYLLIDPKGRLFENSQGKHTYSDPLQDSTMYDCMKQITLNRENFIARGGIYEW